MNKRVRFHLKEVCFLSYHFLYVKGWCPFYSFPSHPFSHWRKGSLWFCASSSSSQSANVPIKKLAFENGGHGSLKTGALFIWGRVVSCEFDVHGIWV